MRLIVSLFLALSMLSGPALADEFDVNPRQRKAAKWGLGFGLGTQAIALTSTFVWAVSGSGTALVISIPADIANAPMSVAGIQGFEGILRDGTVAGRYRGLGIGFLEGGIYSLSMGGVLLGGLARHSAVCNEPWDGEGFAPCFEDVTPLIVAPITVTYFAVGAVYTAIGAGFLHAANREGTAALKLRVAPTFAGGPDGFRIGIVGRF